MAKETKVKITHEKSEPRDTLVANLREQMERPFVFKMGRTEAENLAAEVRKSYDERKGDWFDKLGKGIMAHFSYAPVPGRTFAVDDFDIREDIMAVIEAFKTEMGINTDKPPKQGSLA